MTTIAISLMLLDLFLEILKIVNVLIEMEVSIYAVYDENTEITQCKEVYIFIHVDNVNNTSIEKTLLVW